MRPVGVLVFAQVVLEQASVMEFVELVQDLAQSVEGLGRVDPAGAFVGEYLVGLHITFIALLFICLKGLLSVVNCCFWKFAIFSLSLG